MEQSEARRASDHERLVHALRIIRDGDPANWNRLWELRADPSYEMAFTETEPLVSILVPTFDNWEGLRDRALPSVLAQTYENWECVIVGDAAPPETAEVVASFGDARLKFVNLPYRGPYPDGKHDAWLISGTNPFNTAMRLAQGRWIGATADDDALLPGAVESLLARARERGVEVAYGLLRVKHPDGPDEIMGDGPPPRCARWGLQASLFHAGLRFVPLLYSDWLFGVPNDWSWGERLLRIGVRFAMLEEPVVDYYPSFLWKLQQQED
jgi:glycosyltransferase involved in cell wall biosynthesis